MSGIRGSRPVLSKYPPSTTRSTTASARLRRLPAGETIGKRALMTAAVDSLTSSPLSRPGKVQSVVEAGDAPESPPEASSSNTL